MVEIPLRSVFNWIQRNEISYLLFYYPNIPTHVSFPCTLSFQHICVFEIHSAVYLDE